MAGPKQLLSEYEANEETNAHMENYMLLAKNYGSVSDVNFVSRVSEKQYRLGYVDVVDSDTLYRQVGCFYKTLKAEAVATK